ncbi:YIP1 family protein [Roseobacter sp. HKCCA0434]|uniref:YIP1 family protein n=1 Tax=Roseobacter sp. HKCCA0434 TaxID=3079297 RepID=UPI002905F52B|nr:YIP1 family protein [Roseobacter sp. HKCCA0434]
MVDHSMIEEFDITHGHYEERHAGLAWRIVDAWRDMGTSTRRLIREDPAEGRLLFYVLMADIVVFLSWTLKTVVVPHPAAPMPVQVSIVLVLILMGRTALMYSFAGISGFVLRALGGQGSYRDTRAGVFWGAFVAAPFSLAVALITVGLAMVQGADAPDWYVIPLYWVSLVPFIWFISGGLGEAQRMRVAPIFLVLSVLTVATLFVALVASGRGII